MRKSTFVCVLLATTALLTPTTSAAAPISGSDEKSENVTRANMISPSSMMKGHKAMAPADWKFDVSADDIIRETPEGTKSLWSKSGNYYGLSMWGIFEGSSNGMPCTIVESSDGSFYIYDPFAMIDTKSWLKASIEGDRMTVKLPQAVYTDSDGETDYVYVAQLCHFEYIDEEMEEGLYYAEKGETEIIFNKEGDSWVMQTEQMNDHPMIMGLVTADDATWCTYSDWNTAFTPFSADLVTPPADLETEQWAMSMPIEGNYVAGQFVEIGTDSNDIYLRGFSTAFPDSWIKGTVADGKVVFDSKQYLGADEMANTFGYFFGASEEMVYNEEWDFWYTQTTLEDNITFDYDADAKTLLTEGTFVINKGDAELNMDQSITKPIIKVQGEVTDFVPMNPIVGLYSEPGDYAGCFYFDFPMINNEGQLLDSDNLYYRVLVDGEPFVLYSDEYEGIEDGSEEIPFNFSNRNNIGCYALCDVTHFFYFTFSGFDSLDVQTLYKDGDKEYFSDKVNVFTSVSVKAIGNDSEIVSSEWFDLQGRRIDSPAPGIYVKRVSYADGHTESMKTIVK